LIQWRHLALVTGQRLSVPAFNGGLMRLSGKGGWVLCAVGLLAGSGCGITKNMDEMHDATLAMNKTTNGVARTSESIEKLTDELYADLRQGNALTIRSERLRALELAPSQEAKISEAAKYFMAFEFQLWKSYGVDSDQRLTELQKCAVQEFFRDVSSYIPHDRDTSLKPVPSNAMRNLYAIAVTLHEVNPNTRDFVESKGKKPDSMLDLIKRALEAKAGVEAGKRDLAREPSWVSEVLAHEQDAVYLLQLRAAFLPVMVLGRIAAIDTGNEVKDATTLVMMLTSAWDAKLEGQNLVQLATYAKWIRESLKTVAFLADHGYSAALDGKLVRLYQNMNPLVAGAASAPRSGAIAGLQEAVSQFRKLGGG
jgi:hypothetical protein